MPRHPGLQYQDRMALLGNKITYRAYEYMCACRDVMKAEKALSEAQRIRDEAILALKPLEAAMACMCSANDGLFPWGLPRSISREDWEQLTGEHLE